MEVRRVERTRETICPRSPVTFKWRFSSSSRYGITTCVPAFAVCHPAVRYRAQASKKKRTELGDEIAAEEARAAKDGRDVPCDRTAPCRTLRDDRRPAGQGKKFVQGPLVPGK